MTSYKVSMARRACLLVLLALLGLCLGAPAWAAEVQEAKAQAQALHWLQLLGKGDYLAAYELCAPVLQKATTPAEWQKLMSDLAAKTGPSKGRKLLHSRPAKDLPGAPKGEYYLLVYEPGFSKLPKLLEQVALLKGGDGQWRVAGYYLK